MPELQDQPTLTQEQIEKLIESAQTESSNPAISSPLPGTTNTPQDPTQALLAQLHDIQTPDPIGIWPLAIGWWVVIVCLVTICSASAYFITQRYKQNRYKRIAFAKLKQINHNSYSDTEWLNNIIHLIKQLYFAYHTPKSQLSAKTGSQTLRLIGETIDIEPNLIETVDQVLYTQHTRLTDYERGAITAIVKKIIGLPPKSLSSLTKQSLTEAKHV